jgi:hypothetical protein
MAVYDSDISFALLAVTIKYLSYSDSVVVRFLSSGHNHNASCVRKHTRVTVKTVTDAHACFIQSYSIGNSGTPPNAGFDQ